VGRGRTAKKQIYFLSRWLRSRYVTRLLFVSRFGLLPSHATAGIYRCGPVRWRPGSRGYVGHREWQASTSTDTLKTYRRVVDIDTTLLGSGPSPTPGSLRGGKGFGWLVSPLLLDAIHSLTCPLDVGSFPSIPHINLSPLQNKQGGNESRL